MQDSKWAALVLQDSNYILAGIPRQQAELQGSSGFDLGRDLDTTPLDLEMSGHAPWVLGAMDSQPWPSCRWIEGLT
ncbi:hypothetical protein KFK09_015079 [Dendrobium nobile]|uniref:Uncharacterized protein n=1 Tax=Dendrobium nobile TaxID=94219 RepID=A0A8T3B4Y1_DENNO|nr:hypothetical protein KFK09_015079 [Dendrobium nobile]